MASGKSWPEHTKTFLCPERLSDKSSYVPKRLLRHARETRLLGIPAACCRQCHLCLWYGFGGEQTTTVARDQGIENVRTNAIHVDRGYVSGTGVVGVVNGTIDRTLKDGSVVHLRYANTWVYRGAWILLARQLVPPTTNTRIEKWMFSAKHDRVGEYNNRHYEHQCDATILPKRPERRCRRIEVDAARAPAFRGASRKPLAERSHSSAPRRSTERTADLAVTGKHAISSKVVHRGLCLLRQRSECGPRTAVLSRGIRALTQTKWCSRPFFLRTTSVRIPARKFSAVVRET